MTSATDSQLNGQSVVHLVGPRQVMTTLSRLFNSVGLHTHQSASATEFFELIDLDQPGCIVSDVRLPHLSGLEFQAELTARKIPLPLIFLTDTADVHTAVRAMKAGAFDFLLAPPNEQLLLESVQSAIRLGEQLCAREKERRGLETLFTTLTAREQQVLDMIASGRLNKQIAMELNISQKTVEHHRARLMAKLNAASIVDLIRKFNLIRRDDSDV